MLPLKRPIAFFDIEGTGTDPASDRIVSIAILKIIPLDLFGPQREERHEFMFYPGFDMSQEVIDIHGITNEMVKDKPRFASMSKDIHDILSGCDLAGYNLFNYDIPILWEEFYRAFVQWDLTGVQVIDVGNIFKKKEERTLSAAVKFYCGREHDSAHDAAGDTKATHDVLIGQLGRYADLQFMTLEELGEFSKFDDRVDLAGKIVRDADGDPVYNIGKSKGVKVKDDPSFAEWMLGKDFTQNTKQTIRKILEEEYNETEQEAAGCSA